MTTTASTDSIFTRELLSVNEKTPDFAILSAIYNAPATPASIDTANIISHMIFSLISCSRSLKDLFDLILNERCIVTCIDSEDVVVSWVDKDLKYISLRIGFEKVFFLIYDSVESPEMLVGRPSDYRWKTGV